MKLRPLQDRVRFVTPERNGLFPFNPSGGSDCDHPRLYRNRARSDGVER